MKTSMKIHVWIRFQSDIQTVFLFFHGHTDISCLNSSGDKRKIVTEWNLTFPATEIETLTIDLHLHHHHHAICISHAE